MRMKKRGLALLMAAVLVISPMSALAQEASAAGTGSSVPIMQEEKSEVTETTPKETGNEETNGAQAEGASTEANQASGTQGSAPQAEGNQVTAGQETNADGAQSVAPKSGEAQGAEAQVGGAKEDASQTGEPEVSGGSSTESQPPVEAGEGSTPSSEVKQNAAEVSGTQSSGSESSGTQANGTQDSDLQSGEAQTNGTQSSEIENTSENTASQNGVNKDGTATDNAAQIPSEDTQKAEGTTEENTNSEGTEGTDTKNGKPESVSENSVSGNELSKEKESETDTASKKMAAADTSSEGASMVQFNTGNSLKTVVDANYTGNEIVEGYFEEDGSYRIQLPEINPFFPYEVQFTYNGEVTSEWFMSPDDSVEIGGHTFYVSAFFDNTQVTQMSLNVGGETVIVYPEPKQFMDFGGVTTFSLRPLQEKKLDIDLSDYTPAELTMVSMDRVFMGENVLTDTSKVVWKYSGDNDYMVSSSGDKLDLSYGATSYNTLTTWEMIVGTDDQLDAGNIRYLINTRHKPAGNWLAVTAYTQDSNGVRTQVPDTAMDKYFYNQSSIGYSILSGSVVERESYMQRIYISSEAMGGSINDVYISLDVNRTDFPNSGIKSFKIYKGFYKTATEAAAGEDITAQICNADMTQKNAGYYKGTNYSLEWVTIVTYDENGQVNGCLPFILYFTYAGHLWSIDLKNKEGYSVYSNSTIEVTGKEEIRTFSLDEKYPVDQDYYLKIDYYDLVTDESAVTAAYIGKYNSIAEATAAGATDIKDSLTGKDGSVGYEANYSQGVQFTIFCGADGEANQKVYYKLIKAENGTNGTNSSQQLNSGTTLWLNGLRDSNGSVDSYIVESGKSASLDSYGEYNYLTVFVGENVDLTNLAPTFWESTGAKVYVAGSTTPEVSGQSFHDFSKGAIQYTVSAEDGENAKNYWVQVVKATAGKGQLHINSLEDANANTRVENGIIYSTREVMLDGYHDHIHEILIANVGTEAIPNLSAELVSDTVKLDEYWTLKGVHELPGFSTTQTTTSYGELPNLAKLRLVAKEGVTSANVTGTLTIKSGDTVLMVLTLTGIVGDPAITTESVPQTVKYVPYGTVIQNNNKYSWNKVSYQLVSGTLPNGMTVKPNGELYGVPDAAGEYTFTVRMTNSYSSFKNSEKTYILTIVENTDPNVDAATDTGYDLTEKVQNIHLDFVGATATGSQTIVSEGVYGEFIDIYLDGNKLIKDTDYTSESGSTRITILNQTLVQPGPNSAGTHTLGIEFRTSDTDTLKRAAQNYVVSYEQSNTNTGSGSSSDNNADAGSTGGNESSNTDSNNSGSSGNSGTAGGNAGSGSQGGNTGNNGGTNNNAGNTAQNTATAGGGVTTSSATGGRTISTQTPSGEIISTISHTVQQGETLWLIAVKYFGSGQYWRKIQEDNADTIRDANKIYVGQIILIKQQQQPVAAEIEEAGETAGETAEEIYTVKAGDTLWRISQQLYGNGRDWRRIYTANTDVIVAPERIYVGQKLKIPR